MDTDNQALISELDLDSPMPFEVFHKSRHNRKSRSLQYTEFLPKLQRPSCESWGMPEKRVYKKLAND